MRIIARKALVAFFTEHADAEIALEDWYDKTSNAEWDNFADLKKSFGSADLVGNNRVIFNIKGNDYRLIAIVLFKIKMVYIRFIGTHAAYSKLTKDDITSI